MKLLSREPEALACCGLPTPPRAYRYVMLAVIVIVIVLSLRYGITIPLPGVVLTGGAGYTITVRAPRVLAARARFS